MQRILKYGNIQNISLIRVKELNIWLCERLPTSSYARVTNFLKWSVLWPTMYYVKLISISKATPVHTPV